MNPDKLTTQQAAKILNVSLRHFLWVAKKMTWEFEQVGKSKLWLKKDVQGYKDRITELAYSCYTTATLCQLLKLSPQRIHEIGRNFNKPQWGFWCKEDWQPILEQRKVL